MPVEYAIDANVILQFVLADHPGLFAKARDIFAAAEAGEVTLHCDPVNLGEVVWVLSSHYKVSCADIESTLTSLLSAAGFVVPDKQRYMRALALFGAGKLRFGDACACAAAEKCCEGRLVSFDRALSKTEGIERVEAV